MTQKTLVSNVEKESLEYLALLGQLYSANPIPSETDELSFEVFAQYASLFESKGVVSLLVFDPGTKEEMWIIENEGSKYELRALVQSQMGRPESLVAHIGSVWAVLWRHSRYLMRSAKIDLDNGEYAIAGLTLPLEPVYQSLRKYQKIVMLYIIINLLIISFFLSRKILNIYFRPIQRLVKRAGEYQNEPDFLFSVRKEDNELSKLSSALNNMLNRISRDKLKLSSTVERLEQVNLKLKSAQNKIIRAEKLASVGRLSSGIAHEIGNPIGIVLGYLELLRQDSLLPATRNDYIHRAENEINRIDTIIRQLLNFSRSSVDTAKSVDVHKLLAEIVEVVTDQPLASGIEIKQQYDASEHILPSDVDLLKQVFLNLIINSVDAVSATNGTGGEIIIGTSNSPRNESVNGRDTKIISINVTDNGLGIEKENIDNIFDPFFTTKDPGKGTGLGLYVCLMIVEKLGGNIKVGSKADKGTTMTISLPIQDEIHAKEI
ncbi:MAG: hypothetical protein HKM93_03130 [Desulfobacteraceae bacterium]|nr:hypothetical protein [Desulfobacteraceae bacterium]